MKKDWTYKKFEEVTTKCANISWNKVNSEIEYSYVDLASVNRDNLQIEETQNVNALSAPSRAKQIIHQGDVLFGTTRPTLKRVCIVPEDYDGQICSTGFCVLRPNKAVITEWIFYNLCANNFYDYIESLQTGANYPAVSDTIVKSFSIPVPPLSIQRSIVAELDLLHSVISKKKEQLRELDNLAQSLFYQMFGDPITNPMGWEIKKLGEVAPVKSYQGEILSEKGLFWLLNLDMVEAQTGKILEKTMVDKDEIGNSTTSFSPDNVLYSKLRPYLNKVVLPDTCGYCTTELLPLLPQRDILNREYLCYLLRSKSFVDYINIKVAGAKMPRVTMDDFRNFSIPLPPLSLQQSFAAKVSAIEAQKQAITQSIHHTEALLAQRMDQYFA